MKKLLLSMAAAGFMLIALVGCKGGSNDPKAVAQSFMDAITKKDFDGAAKFATEDSKSALEMLKSVMKMGEAFGGKGDDMDFAKAWKGKKVTYSDAKIEGDNATVSLMVDGKEEMPISLKKGKDGWKVAFDKNTLMKTGTDKLNEVKDQNMPAIDSTLQNLDQLQDSLKTGVETVDSVKKAIEN